MALKTSTLLTANMPSGYNFCRYLCNYELYCLPQQLLLKMNDMHKADWSK